MTTNFEVIGQFEDNVTSGLQNIKRLLRNQLSIQKRLNAATRRTMRIQENLVTAQEQTAEASSDMAENASSIVEEATAAKLAAGNIGKIANAIQKGVGNGIRRLQAIVGKLGIILQRSFSEAMRDQLDDIQATAAAYGSLVSEGLIKGGPGSYKKAKGIYKQLDSAIAKVVRTSTAPTSTITGFSRTLTDNLLPTLLKEAKKKGMTVDQALEPAAEKLAKFYEKAALLTPSGYNPGMVSKSLQMALGGSSEAQLSKYDFFQMNPTVMNKLKTSGFFNITDFGKKFDILQQALETGLPQASIDEMQQSISGGFQALEDTFWNPSVGILSFARAFAKDVDDSYITRFRDQLINQKKLSDKGGRFKGDATATANDISSPLEMVAITVGPFLQDISNLLGKSGPIMGNVALFWNRWFGPALRSLTWTLKVLQDNVNRDLMNLPQALGRLTAEAIKVVSGMFEGGILIDGNPVVSEFIKGFNSLGKEYDFMELFNRLKDNIIQILESIVFKVAAAIIVWSVVWALAGAVVQIATQIIVSGLITILKLVIPKVFMWAVATMFPAIGTFLIGTLAPLLVMAILATVVLGLIVRYRQQIMLQLQGIRNVLQGLGKILLGLGVIMTGIMSIPVAWVVDLIVSSLSKLPFIGDKVNPSGKKGMDMSMAAINQGIALLKQGTNEAATGGAKVLEANRQVMYDLGNLTTKLGSQGKSVLDNLVVKKEKTEDKGIKHTESTSQAAQAGTELMGAMTTAAIEAVQLTVSVNQFTASIKTTYLAIAKAIGGLAPVIRSMATTGFNAGMVNELSGDMMQRAKSMFQTLRSMGFSKYGAAALVGSMMQESGINPSAIEGNGQGHGLLQWSYGRRDALKQRYGNEWNKTSNQLEFMMSEAGSESALRRLMNAQSREEAFAAEKAYIRYKIAGKRYSYADRIMQQPWFKYKGYIPKQFNNIDAFKNNITQTHAMIKQASTLKSKHEENLDYDLLDPKYSGEQQLFMLGKKVAEGVVSSLDDTISHSTLYSFT